VSVAIVRWPDEAENIPQLKAIGAPRLLLVAEDAPLPTTLDFDEDWVRLPASDSDVVARAELLAVRAAQRTSEPILNGDGRLAYRGRWVALSHTEELAAKVLADRFREVVPAEALLSRGDHEITSTGVRTLIMRLRRRVEPLGLVVRTVHGRGYVLDVP
jgi:DNA-binding response OmpR family regulator